MKNERCALDCFDFLSGHVVEAAQMLIGCRIIRANNDEIESYRIIETEAYHESEPGSHTYRGKTKRNSTMYENHGLLYVYLIYGVYYCANVVCGSVGEGAAVLIRAIEPISQMKDFERNKPMSNAEANRFAGPGKLCRELNITQELNGIDLLDESNKQMYLFPKPLTEKVTIKASTRIGISRGKDLEWRFVEADNPCVSRRV